MSDAAVAALLRSGERLVVIEAPAGCGKTYQGASYARDIARTLGTGRLLILTHTHGACGVFANRTRGAGDRVDIRTIDALVAQVATAYHQALGLPADQSAWVYQNNGAGFGIAAQKVAHLLSTQPMIARAIAQRYPVIVCDEHQDCTAAQHAMILAIYGAGAGLRIFGDPLQRIFGESKSNRALLADRFRWDQLKAQGATESLRYPHRWDTGCPELGAWVLAARERLQAGQPIDLSGRLPPSLTILRADNVSLAPRGYSLENAEARDFRRHVRANDELMVLSNNSLVRGVNAFLGRSVQIWEGHQRDNLANLALAVKESAGDAEALASALATFVSSISKGFAPGSHGNPLIQEAREGCRRNRRKGPGNLQRVARCVVDNPSHRGVGQALSMLGSFIGERADGFKDVCIDHRAEFRDATKLATYDCPVEAFADIARRRSLARPSPPLKVLSSIHKAKGLECENALVITTGLTGSMYSRYKLYVALSRARRSLALVIPKADPGPLFRI